MQIFNQIKDIDGNQAWFGLSGLAISFAAVKLSLVSNQFITLIAKDSRQAQQYHQEISFIEPDITIVQFPDWETLAYDDFSAHEDITSQRIACLMNLPKLEKGILIIPIATMLQRVCPATFLTQYAFSYQIGDTVNLSTLRTQLQHAGYHCVQQVSVHGEFAVRGSIIDVFPMGSKLPVRLDLFDNDIETIRTFSVEDQRSVDKIEKIHLLPAKEFPFNESDIQQFKTRWRIEFDSNPLKCPLYQDVSNAIPAAGIDYYLPLFFDELATISDYLPKNSTIIYSQGSDEQAQIAWKDIETRYEQFCHDLQKPILPPNKLWQTPEQLFNTLKTFKQVKITQSKGQSFLSSNVPKVNVDNKLQNPLYLLESFKHDFSGRILLCAESLGRREVINQLLQQHMCSPCLVDNYHAFIEGHEKFCLTIADIPNSTIIDNIAIISENSLFEQHVSQQRRRKASKSTNEVLIKSLAELTIGEPIVHIEHGIGRFLGLDKMSFSGQENEFVTIEYGNNEKLYVPVTALHLLSRYSNGHLEHAPIHRLGNTKWDKAKRKALQKAYDVATELLHIYAKREASKGVAFQINHEDYQNFSQQFSFEETPDQMNAIQQVELDLTKIQPMDRVICGDVGFGKTEVAMRAAFITTQNNQQVAILVPTTLLAEQHGQNFIDRFAQWPVNIAVLSRFKSKSEQDIILQQLIAGTVDIVIGTHKLIQKNIQFKQLGLIIIDEEHRFGVRQKEQLKKAKANTNILTMTATPIPRTLNMSMAGIRDFSIIATPPAKRLSIKTFLYERKKHIILEAIQRELHRGGQVFFLHNNVSTINLVATELREWLPGIRIEIGHGQLRERELERIMTDFYHRRFNILLCTTIIENGIDIPTANTIIIDRADKLGLAQLHQLRGRVGRSHHQAYAYLLRPDKSALTSDAKKRLDAIVSMGDLGAGFTLATHDLEIRGAGEFLGEEQSGQVQELGFSLYLDILEKAVNDLKSGKTPTLDYVLDYGPEVEIHLPTLIPEQYIPDINIRLQLYQRIANCQTSSEIDDLQVEMIDRFGLLPDHAKNLIQVTVLKQQMQAIGVKKININASRCKIIFNEKTQVDPTNLIRLIQTRPITYQLKGADQLIVKLNKNNTEIFEQLNNFVVKALTE